jgi:hypothetical protein
MKLFLLFIIFTGLVANDISLKDLEELKLVKDFGIEVVLLESEEDSDGDDTNKEFVINLTDKTSGEISTKVIIVNNQNATSTTTDIGNEITGSVVDAEKQVDSKIEINTNGILAATIKRSELSSGTSKSMAIVSTKPNSNVKVDRDGSVEVSDSEDGINFSATLSADGSAIHKIEITDEDGNSIVTKSQTSTKDSVVTILDDGSVQTKSKVTQDDNSEVLAVVEGKSDGKATHILKLSDSYGESVTVKSSSEIPGAQTTISEDGGISTTATTKDSAGQEVRCVVQASIDGRQIHTVSAKDTSGNDISSSATSEIKGATTLIESTGNIKTSATPKEFTISGKKIEAIVDTLPNGEAYTRFEITDLSTGEAEKRETIKDGSFEPGNGANIRESDGKVLIDVTTKVTKKIVF